MNDNNDANRPTQIDREFTGISLPDIYYISKNLTKKYIETCFIHDVKNIQKIMDCIVN